MCDILEYFDMMQVSTKILSEQINKECGFRKKLRMRKLVQNTC